MSLVRGTASGTAISGKSLIAVLAAFFLVIGILPVSQTAQAAYANESAVIEPTVISETTTIAEGGVYQLSPKLTNATITLATSAEVTLVGSGVGEGNMTDANTGIAIVGQAAGTNLVLKDVKLANNVGSANVINFVGGNNSLTFVGTSLIEGQGNGGSTKAMIRVAPDATLAVGGTGVLYFYAQGQGAGFGADAGAKCGDLVFSSLTIFGKTTHPGPAIGSGASYGGPAPSITFNSGEYTLVGNSMAAMIGGGAGSGGGAAPTPGGNVTINGGIFTLNVDYSGAAIGGGGYSGGNNASGGTAVFNGGSVRTYVDTNAVNQWASKGITAPGVSTVVITATKLNTESEPVYLLPFDTQQVAAASNYVVTVDGQPFYNGGLHRYRFANEDVDRDKEERPIANTLANWVDLVGETKLYFFVSGTTHTLNVNGEEFSCTFNEETESFALSAIEPPVLTVDTSWYNTTDTEFTLSSLAQFKGFAAIVNNKQETADAGAVIGIDPGIPADDFAGKTVHLACDLDLGGVEQSAASGIGSAAYTSPVWSGDAWTPIATYSSSGYHGAGSDNGIYGRPFKGTFDGGFHTISGLYIPGDPSKGYDNAATNGHALFGELGHDGVVKNIIVASGSVRGARFTAGIVGRNWGHVENCANYAFIETDGDRSGGGIVGVNYENTPSDGHSPWVINSINGGIIIKGDQRYSGGIAGDNEGLVANSYNIGTGAQKFSPYSLMGGIVGGGRNAGTLTNNWSLSGEGQPTRINGNSAALPAGGNGFKTADEMKTPEFAAALGDAFVYTEGSYPQLRTAPEPPALTVDTSWYNTTDTEFVISTLAQLKGLAAIVNGTAEGIAQDDFAGKTLTQAADIALAEAGLFTTATGAFGSTSYSATFEYYVLHEDAPLWTPIGSGVATGNDAYTSTNYFAGTFDGAGYSMSGLYTNGALTVQGLFGCVSGTIKNVNVSSGLVSAKIVAGGIAAYLNGGTITNCSNAAVIYANGGEQAGSGLENGISGGGAIGGIVGNVAGSTEAPFSVTGNTNSAAVVCTNTAKGGRAGGIVGLINEAGYAGSVAQNLNSGSLNSYQFAGGIVGFNGSKVAPISQSVNHGTVKVNSGGSAYGGGIVSHSYSSVSNCYNTGNYVGYLHGRDKAAYLGGIVSNLFAPATVSNCYNTGHLVLGGTATSSSSVGRIVGAGGATHSTDDANINNCYYITVESSSPESVDVEKGWLAADAGKTAAELASNAFVNLLNAGGSAFNVDSQNSNGGYPVLAWQGGTPATPNPPEAGEPRSGDIDGDGQVTAAEALMLARYVTGLSSLTPAQQAAADIDGDGILTMADVVKILRKAAGLSL